MKVEKLKQQHGHEKETRGSRRVHCVVRSFENIMAKLNSIENDMQAIKKILTQIQHSTSILPSNAFATNITTVNAVGQFLEQNQSEFCPHWIPPVLAKQENAEI